MLKKTSWIAGLGVMLVSSNALVPEANAKNELIFNADESFAGGGRHRHNGHPHGRKCGHRKPHHGPHPHHGEPKKHHCSIIPAGVYDLNNATLTYGYDTRLHVSYEGENQYPVIVMRFFQPGANAEDTIVMVATPGSKNTKVSCQQGLSFINWDNVPTTQGVFSGKLTVVPEEGSKSLIVKDSYLSFGNNNKPSMKFVPIP